MNPAVWLSLTLMLFTAVPPVRGLATQPAAPAPSASLSHAPGSVVRFEHLSIQDGLSQNAGLAIFQDSRGYLWIGSQDGLNRYDGYTFTIFKHDAEDPASISHNSILSIAEDNGGALWFGTWGGGLNRFDPAAETFIQYRHNSDDPASLSSDTVTSIKQDSSGRLWVGTLGGLDLFNPQSEGFDHFRHDPAVPDSLSSNAISVIFEDTHGQLWIGTGALGVQGAGLNRFDPDTGKSFHYWHHYYLPESLASNNISSMYEAPDGTFWIGTGGFSLPGNGLDRFDPRSGTAHHFTHDPKIGDSLSGNDIAALWGDAGGTLWIGTWSNGLNRMDFSNPGEFTRYQHDPYFPETLSGNEIWSLFRDRSGILWVGTAHSGLNKLLPGSGQFSLYRHHPDDPNSPGADTVGAFSEDRYGRIWIGTLGGGLDRLDPRRGRFKNFHNDPADPASLSNNVVMAVHGDSRDRIWVGTLGGGLNRFDLLSGRIIHYRHVANNPATLPDNNVVAIISDSQDGIWIGTYGGLSHYDPATDSFTNYVADPANPAGLSENKIVNLYLDPGGSLWIGTWGGGLNHLDLNDPLHADPQLATFRKYRHNPDDPASLGEDSVWVIHQTADGTLWLGTQAGLNRFDLQTQAFQLYTEQDGLPNNTVIGILEDDDGNLWLTTNNGLARFNPYGKSFTTYDMSDGLQSNEFTSNAYFRSRDGTMYIGGINGFNAFRPENIQPILIPPQVVITKFEVYNEPLVTDLSGRSTIQLSYQQDFIAFEFAALDFQSPLKNQYAYKLEGFDQDWIRAGNRRYATYTNLPGGKYVFHVKASNSDGIWNSEGVSVPITVTPPVWQTWWFQLLAALALAGLVVGGFRWRLSIVRGQKLALEEQVAIRTSELQLQIEQRQKVEQALAEKAAQEAVTVERTRLARDLHDAVTQTLFSASLIAEVLPDLWELNQAEASRRFEELRQLTRGALAEMRTLLVELRPSALTEIPLPDLLRQLCESLIGRARLPIQLQVEGGGKLAPDVQVGLYRIAQEALHNVVKHAKATQAVVTLRLNEAPCLSVADNGCGFDPAAVPPDRLGLEIMRERAEAIGARLSISSEPGEGTQISVSWKDSCGHEEKG